MNLRRLLLTGITATAALGVSATSAQARIDKPGSTYRGQTEEGFPASFKTSADGRHITHLNFKASLECVGSSTYNVTLIYSGAVRAKVVDGYPDNDFDVTKKFVPNGTPHQATVSFAGDFTRGAPRKATGTAYASVELANGDNCNDSLETWQAKVG